MCKLAFFSFNVRFQLFIFIREMAARVSQRPSILVHCYSPESDTWVTLLPLNARVSLIAMIRSLLA